MPIKADHEKVQYYLHFINAFNMNTTWTVNEFMQSEMASKHCSKLLWEAKMVNYQNKSVNRTRFFFIFGVSLVMPSSTMSCILQHDEIILELSWSTTRT